MLLEIDFLGPDVPEEVRGKRRSGRGHGEHRTGAGTPNIERGRKERKAEILKTEILKAETEEEDLTQIEGFGDFADGDWSGVSGCREFKIQNSTLINQRATASGQPIDLYEPLKAVGLAPEEVGAMRKSRPTLW
jgi:hypothetical protein